MKRKQISYKPVEGFEVGYWYLVLVDLGLIASRLMMNDNITCFKHIFEDLCSENKTKMDLGKIVVIMKVHHLSVVSVI